MLKNYFTVAWRNLVRNTTFSLINIAGLSIGLTVCFLIFEYVAFESTYDSFHEKSGLIYRVALQSTSESGTTVSATNHPAVGLALQADYPEVKSSARLVRVQLMTGNVSVSRETSPGDVRTFNEESVYFADSTFLPMFSFPFVEGSAATALQQPATIVITQTLARKYFGDEPALGKELKMNGSFPVKITGVLKDLPQNSHLQFDILVSFSTVGGRQFFATMWTWPEFYNYVELIPGASVKNLEAKLPGFCEKYLGKVMQEYRWKITMFLQPIRGIHLTSHLGSEQSANGNAQTVWFLTLLAIFILVIAWINYINLSTAKAMERSKEVGIRKTAGAGKGQLILQFFFDAFLVNTLALVVAVFLLAFATPLFESLVDKKFSAFMIDSGILRNPVFWLSGAGFIVLGTVLVGLYPSLVLSSFNPAVVLKGRFYKSTGGIRLRQSLVAFQYVLSVLLIAGTIALYRQLTYMQKADPGYARDQVFVIKTPTARDSTFESKVQHYKSVLAQLPAVKGVTVSTEIPGRAIKDGNGVRRQGQAVKDNLNALYANIDDAFVPTYELKLAAGRNFIETDRNNLKVNVRVMVNEYLAQHLGFVTPEEAVGQTIVYGFGPTEYPAEIIGVIKNYHQRSLQNNYEPILYHFPDATSWTYYSIRLDTDDLQGTLKMLETGYRSTFSYSAYDYFFLDDFFNRQYASDVQFANIFGVFTGLAILISCLGLLGLSIFAITHRTREVGIRKVLGAPISSILLLFSKDSVRILVISYVIAAPICYFAIQKWLENFSFHMNIGAEIFLAPPLFLLVISLTTVSVVCLKAAMANPTKALKHE